MGVLLLTIKTLSDCLLELRKNPKDISGFYGLPEAVVTK
jgi:hypothetical protein